MRIGVFTGSGQGPAGHQRAVEMLAAELARAGVGIVYGGAARGLMGRVADAALAAGGEVIGVIPQHLVDRELAHPGLSSLEVVTDLHERKARMNELSDAFVALPGGTGTLDEFFEVWTWGQLGLHTKPVALYNCDGHFDRLIDHLAVMRDNGYLSGVYRDSLGTVAGANELLAWIDEYRPPAAKWTSPTAATSTHHIESVAWIHVVEGRLLAVRTRGRELFYLPGGKIEPGETPAAALVREVHEELGVRLAAVTPAFTVEAPAHGLEREATLMMRCFFAAGDTRPRAAAEIEEVGWLTVPADDRAAPACAATLARLAH